ncbi:DNA recombination/repair protein RecA, partial [Candidatus Microgenomates bacterium]|nr:DNA recombination/repair protein RecA [Candidatus Microgenomates bacterium]
VAPPFRMAEFDVLADSGISKEGGLIDVGIALGVLGKSGAFLRFGETMIGQGKQAAIMLLREKPEMARKIHAAIVETSKKSQPQVTVGIEEQEN